MAEPNGRGETVRGETAPKPPPDTSWVQTTDPPKRAICSECWFQNCRNCSGGSCAHVTQGHYEPERAREQWNEAYEEGRRAGRREAAQAILAEADDEARRPNRGDTFRLVERWLREARPDSRRRHRWWPLTCIRSDTRCGHCTVWGRRRAIRRARELQRRADLPPVTTLPGPVFRTDLDPEAYLKLAGLEAKGRRGTGAP